jgi:hypothetical protein
VAARLVANRGPALFVCCVTMVGGAHVGCAGEATSGDRDVVRTFVGAHCLDCHDDAGRTAGLSLESLDQAPVDVNADAWEQVVRRLRARQMPPPDADRPDELAYARVLEALEAQLDRAATAHPRPGRTETFRRLTRTEYKNAIRDLLALDVDVDALLPADEASHGFDNVTVSGLSPTLLSRYVGAAQAIARLALGGAEKSPGGATFRLRPDLTQEQHVEGLPLGTRGGAVIRYAFPRAGAYDFEVRLMRDRNEHVEGLNATHQCVVLVDRESIAQFAVEPPRTETEHLTADRHLRVRAEMSAGPHDVGVTFLEQSAALLETKRQPYNASFNMHRHPRQSPAVYQVTITGPIDAGSPGDTPSRRRILATTPALGADDQARARAVLAPLVQRAYRRPINDDDLRAPLRFFGAASQTGGFDAGVEAALSAVLVNPNFLFRIERDPADAAPGAAYRVSDVELASRLSFFLWSSIPDDELLAAAIAGRLHEPAVLDRQVRRMLADERAESLATNFGGQWLYLRNLDSIVPDPRLFPDFDDNLRQAMRRESELFLDHLRREDRSVLELIDARYTFLNERLARHYGVPHVYGSEFRRVELDPASHRGGILRHGSVLTVTSYATRTSPVLRGNWVLKNLVGLAPPPPPPNVPALTDNRVAASLPIRERLAQHRADPTCAACHDRMDPVGFALENFDAVGRWRELEGGRPVDAAGGLPDGSEFTGVAGLEQGLLAHPDVFVGTLTERLLTFALGRGVEPADAPAVRDIVRQASADDWRFSSLILGIARSVPFQMRALP